MITGLICCVKQNETFMMSVLSEMLIMKIADQINVGLIMFVYFHRINNVLIKICLQLFFSKMTGFLNEL